MGSIPRLQLGTGLAVDALAVTPGSRSRPAEPGLGGPGLWPVDSLSQRHCFGLAYGPYSASLSEPEVGGQRSGRP